MNAAPVAPTARVPTRAPSRAPGTLKSAAVAGPGAIIRPAVSVDSPQTAVRKRTVPSSIAAKATKKSVARRHGKGE